MTRPPPALWLALLGVMLTGAGLTAWTAHGGALRGLDAGPRHDALQPRDSTPELAARSYYDALRAGRPELARALVASTAVHVSRANRRVLEGAPREGRSSFRVDETHRIAQDSLRLIGVLTVDEATRASPVNARFDVVKSSAGYRVARMQLTQRPEP